MSMLLVQSGVFISAVLLTGMITRLAPRLSFLDRPVARSAHVTPVPVGGGIAIVLALLATATWGYASGVLPEREWLALMAGLVIAVTGLIDDAARVPVLWRASVQFATAVWVVAWLGGVPAIDFGLFALDWQWLLVLLAVLGLVWLTNLYNFMDGIDGLAASELVFVTLVSLFFVLNAGDGAVALLIATLLSAGAGFLVWNWPPARIFMGDVGSGFIGFSLGVLALLTMHHGTLTVWSWMILLAVFIADATVTLLRRWRRRQKWYESHACHAYQHAARRYRSHGRVTMTVILIDCAWLAPLCWLSVQRPHWGFYLSLLALTPLCLLAVKFGAGQPIETALAATAHQRPDAPLQQQRSALQDAHQGQSGRP